MNIGYRTVAFGDLPLSDTLRHIAEAGYQSVELCLESPGLDPLELNAARVGEINELLGQLGLSVAAVSYHGITDQLEVRRQRTAAAIGLLPHFGAKVFVVASRREEPARLHVQWDEGLQLYAELAEQCATHGCQLAVEPSPGLVVRGTDDIIRLVQQCEGRNVAAVLDVAHAAVTGDNLSWALYQLKGRLALLHVADVRRGVHEHLVPGQGDLDFAELREAVEGIGYTGDLVLEMEELSERPVELAQEAIKAFKSLWYE